MRGTIKHETGLRFLAKAGSGQEMVLDASKPEKERLGPTPMEAIMLSAGGCSAMDVIYILGKMRRMPESFEVDVEARRAEEDPRVFVSLNLHYRFRGEGLEPASVERAIGLSREKYCSALIMLERAGVRIGTSYDITPSGID